MRADTITSISPLRAIMSANGLLNSPIEASAQPIELGWSSQRLALRDSREDWTGLTNPTKRRKLQNRLNQRARRERARKSSAREASATTKSSPSQEHEPPSAFLCVASAEVAQSPQGLKVPAVPASRQLQPQGCMTSVPEVRALMDRFADHAYASYIQGEPAVAHLHLLIKYNVSTSLARNAALLGVVEEFYKWDGISPMNQQGPLLGLTFHNQFADWPATLQPTALQLSMDHHPWVDCFPWPQLRDNLLIAFEHPEICDEDELCHDICDLNDEKESMLLIWGAPDDPSKWEVTDEFLRKWAWLLNGCEAVIVSTNHWRVKRGEAPITPQQFAERIRLSYSARLNSSGISH